MLDHHTWVLVGSHCSGWTPLSPHALKSSFRGLTPEGPCLPGHGVCLRQLRRSRSTESWAWSWTKSRFCPASKPSPSMSSLVSFKAPLSMQKAHLEAKSRPREAQARLSGDCHTHSLVRYDSLSTPSCLKFLRISGSDLPPPSPAFFFSCPRVRVRSTCMHGARILAQISPSASLDLFIVEKTRRLRPEQGKNHNFA